MKNLVLIHLESISNTILWQYRVELGTVWRLMQSSQRFTRFHSSATSTAMVLDDLELGFSNINDAKSNYSSRAYTRTSGIGNEFSNLLCFLVYFSGYMYFLHSTNFLSRSDRVAAGVRSSWNVDTLLSHLRNDLDAAIKSDKPFYLNLNNNVSHMALDDAYKLQATSFADRFRRGYLVLDAWLNQFLSVIAEKSVWDNTIFVCYGDHGDELWSHGLNKGFCHGIAPYASLTWTPFFIFEPGVEPGDDDRVMSMIDVKRHIITRLYGGRLPEEAELLMDNIRFEGADVGRERRERAFSQNLYALQLEYGEWEKALTKGYSVTDGVYRLIAVSGGLRSRESGLEFYCDRVDPANSRNLLDFFHLDANGNIVSFAPPPEAMAPAFALTFNSEAVHNMMETYDSLRSCLMEYVRKKEKGALLRSSGEYHLMPENAFCHARKRKPQDDKE